MLKQALRGDLRVVAAPAFHGQGFREGWQLHRPAFPFLPLEAFNEAAVCKAFRRVGSASLAFHDFSNHMLFLSLWEWLPEDPRVWVARDLMSETEVASFGALNAVPNLEGPQEARRISTAM